MPLNDAIAHFTRAVDTNDFDKMDDLAKELDRIMLKRLRRLRYKNVPARELLALMEVLPEGYDTPVAEKVYALWDAKTPAERDEIHNRGRCNGKAS
jgi:hypothetical protein